EDARRYDNKACRPLAPTAQRARLDIGVSGRRCRQGKTKKRSDKCKASRESYRHGSPFLRNQAAPLADLKLSCQVMPPMICGCFYQHVASANAMRTRVNVIALVRYGRGR